MASITELCVGDHHNDPEALAAWTRNKSVPGVVAMLANPDLAMLVAERDGLVLAVGAINRDGSISLNYVAPHARFTGISSLLLSALENGLRDMGHVEGRLEATLTARDFYRKRGWHDDGPQAQGRMVNGYPMRKRL